MSVPLEAKIVAAVTVVATAIPCAMWVFGRSPSRRLQSSDTREQPALVVAIPVATAALDRGPDPTPRETAVPAVTVEPARMSEAVAALHAPVLEDDVEPAATASVAVGTPEVAPEPQACGNMTCAAGDVCCNPSCSICVPAGGTCTNKICGRPETPTSVMCGPNTCNVGQVCCNVSCGICTAPGASCDSKTCDGPVTPQPPVSVPCGMNTCNVGQVCCNPSCGVCAAPGASCDQHLCASASGPTMPVSVACGMNTCNVGQVCCNASCGTCAAPGASCSQALCTQ